MLAGGGGHWVGNWTRTWVLSVWRFRAISSSLAKSWVDKMTRLGNDPWRRGEGGGEGCSEEALVTGVWRAGG